MATARARIAPDPVSAGWAHLADGRWEGARASFEEALARAETPEALEGLSWAAWWLDDAEAVFDARARAYSVYRGRGEAASAARVATWLAADQLDFRGAVAVASGWLRRAQRLLDRLEPSSGARREPSTSGGGSGGTPRRCWKPRSRTSPAPARRWWEARWPAEGAAEYRYEYLLVVARKRAA